MSKTNTYIYTYGTGKQKRCQRKSMQDKLTVSIIILINNENVMPPWGRPARIKA